jgi:dTDP-glucose pyrophosphorylase
MLNIVIPMAGRGSRFIAKGYARPKPLILVRGQPMIRLVIENLRPLQPHRFVFIAQREHQESFGLGELLERWAPGSELICIDGVTEGAACTVLAARDLIDSQHPLMIANSDQWLDVSIDSYLSAMSASHADGLIMTMVARDPKWSFIRRDSDGAVCEVVEKVVVSSEATVGVYNFRHGREFVRAAEAMIRKGLRVNNEFYVAPVYNELIAGGHRIETFSVGELQAGMFGLGTPEDLERFERFGPAIGPVLSGSPTVD